MSPRCDKCCFWSQIFDGGRTGKCRVNAPSPISISIREQREPGDWPKTLAGDWCGSFRTSMMQVESTPSNADAITNEIKHAPPVTRSKGVQPLCSHCWHLTGLVTEATEQHDKQLQEKCCFCATERLRSAGPSGHGAYLNECLVRT